MREARILLLHYLMADSEKVDQCSPPVCWLLHRYRLVSFPSASSPSLRCGERRRGCGVLHRLVLRPGLQKVLCRSRQTGLTTRKQDSALCCEAQGIPIALDVSQSVYDEPGSGCSHRLVLKEPKRIAAPCDSIQGKAVSPPHLRCFCCLSGRGEREAELIMSYKSHLVFLPRQRSQAR